MTLSNQSPMNATQWAGLYCLFLSLFIASAERERVFDSIHNSPTHLSVCVENYSSIPMASIIRSLRGGSTRKKRPQLVVTDEISSSSATNLQSSNRARDADLLYSTRSTSALMNDAVPSHYDELGISSPSAVSLIHVPTDLSGEDRWISMQVRRDGYI